MKRYSALLLLLLSGMTAAVSHAQTQSLRLPRIFADHMVLQRDAKLRFWGWSEPERKVTVEINGVKATARVDAAGDWQVLYPATAAGGPYEVVIRSDAGESDLIRLKDVYFGDVWLASGQSNMEWKVGWKVNNLENEIKDSDYPLIRFFEVPNAISHTPLADVTDGSWVSANPETVGGFSAVAWFFAKHNHKEKNVAVGVIDSTWGGTPAEAWVDANRLLAFDEYRDAARHALDPSVDWKGALAANAAKEKLKWELVGDKKHALATNAQRPDFNDGKWSTVRLPNNKPFHNFVWLRKSFQLSGDAGGPARMQLGELVQSAMVFVNGALIAEKNWLTEGAGYELPAGTLKKGKNVIALRVANDWNNEVYAGKPGKMWLQAGDSRIDLEGDWRFNNTLEPEMPLVFRYNWTPGFLYNAMIRPVEGYRLRGALWYQGESNTDQPQAYAALFKTLITDWRAKWGQGDFPFLFVQLAGFNDRNPNANWPLLREAQADALALPATGMAVALDIGDWNDIHPRNKQDVGKRLWLNARRLAYGEDLVYSGPVYKKHKIHDGKVTLYFDHVGGGFMPSTGRGFVIAGEDMQFHPADAHIRGDIVIVSSPHAPKPVAVRYGWGSHVIVDLYNQEGLPAAPFRTDNW
jgi:sialate O-acetylesterase